MRTQEDSRPAGPLIVAGLGLVAATVSAAPKALAQDSAPDEAAPPHADRKVGEVVVTGVRPLLGDKIPLTVQNTPQSVNVVSQQLLKAQAVTSLEDALKNVPGVTLNAGEGAARGDTINIRGFSAFNDFFLDGIRDAAVYQRDTFDLAEVEVLKGPSATLFGRGSTGGAVNQVSKAPGLDPFASAALEVGTNDDYRATLDIDRPIGPSAALRLNLMGASSDFAGRPFADDRRWGVAPAVTFGLGRPTTLTLAYLHLQENDRPDVGIPFVGAAPAPVPRDSDYGLISDRTSSTVDIGTVRLTHAFSDAVSIADTFRAADYRFDYRFSAPNFGDDVPTASTPLADILVGRDSPSSFGTQTNFTDQLDATARFTTGPLHHVLVVGLELARQTNGLNRLNNPFNTDNSWVAETPLLDPDPSTIAPAQPVAAVQHTNANSEGLYATDTMGLGSHWDLVVGARLDRFAATYHQTNLVTGAVLDLGRTDVVPSPRVALIYKPTPWQSLYVSYGTSFDPSAEALALTTKTADLGPVKATSYEAGAKTRLFDGGLLLTAAVFHTEVDNAQTNDPDNPTITILDGNERVEGFELGATGHIGPRLEIAAGYTYLDGKTSGAASSGTFTNVAIPNLARNAVNLWTEYKLTDAWRAGLGLNYLGRRAANIVSPGVSPAFVPGYVVWNAMTSYRVSQRLTLQLNALNLFNAYYYDSVYYTSAAENHVIPGPGRTLKLTARVDF